MKVVEAVFEHRVVCGEQTTREAERQPEDVDERITFVPGDIPKRDLKVTSYHDQVVCSRFYFVSQYDRKPEEPYRVQDQPHRRYSFTAGALIVIKLFEQVAFYCLRQCVGTKPLDEADGPSYYAGIFHKPAFG
jgi:hypothetical protein